MKKVESIDTPDVRYEKLYGQLVPVSRGVDTAVAYEYMLGELLRVYWEAYYGWQITHNGRPSSSYLTSVKSARRALEKAGCKFVEVENETA